ncbi:MAG TPA: penicillin-binding protein 2 [Candidatus Limnocylindria bacterium]|nr:penicillin-binding protein 2 [Candidatus Limnocylindria bacterium]
MSATSGDMLVADRRILRFVAFGIAVVIGVSGLTARLFYLQVTHVDEFVQQAAQNRTVLQAIPSTRGLVYDRAGRPLVVNEPSFAVKIRPANLPETKRDAVVAQLAGLLRMETADINAAIDGSPGSRFDLVRIAQGVPRETANVIAEGSADLPGVEVSVETQRRYVNGPLMSQILGYTGPIDAAELADMRDDGYQPDDLIGKTGVESVYEAQLRGTYGLETVERDAVGRRLQVLETNRQAEPGNSLKLTIDTREQQLLLKAVQWGMRKAGLKQAVMIVENPQTGEILAMVSLPTYDNNAFAGGISSKAYKKLLANPNKPLVNHAISDQYPPGSTYKLVTGLGALADRRISPTERIQTHPYIQLGVTKFWDWNRAGFGALDIKSGFAHSSDTFFYQVAQRLGISRLAYWAQQLGFGRKTGIDLPAEVPGIVPSEKWKQDTFGQPILPGEVLQAGIGQGYDVATPLQLLNAYAAVANGGTLYSPRVVREIVGPDGSVVRPFKPKVIRKVKAPASDMTIMRLAAREVVTSRHTFNLVELPIEVAGKTGTAEFGARDSQGRLPFHNWFVAFVPAHGDVSKHDSKLAVVAFAYDSNTVGNAATEMVKYYLQLHFKLKVDKRLPYLLARGNFYGGN